MKRHAIITSFLLPILEMGGLIGIFFIAYNLRQITDGIPFIQLTIPYISADQFWPFVISGSIFWGILFAKAGLYRYDSRLPLLELIVRVIREASIWFLLYVAFVYLTTGFIFEKEIPRLIIGYVFIGATLYAIAMRSILYTTMSILYTHGSISRTRILIIQSVGKKSSHNLETSVDTEYTYREDSELENIRESIRQKEIDVVFLMDTMDEDKTISIIELCGIYGVVFCYPKVPEYVYDISRQEGYIGGMPVIETSALAMSAWDRILKRVYDICAASIAIILLSPIFLIIMIAIKIEDKSGPIIYKNRRIGYMGKEFDLYKFRYMYWKDSIKEAYGIAETADTALAYEEHLRKLHDKRNGPLYKIENDPRKTKVGRILEKFSLDELPQLWNVLIGNMSLVGPRPHQPREVREYEEHHHQALTVKPGITGLAQVSGREKNSFEQEIIYDIHYIEHYSIVLDMLILIKTLYVVMMRVFSEKPLQK